MNRSPLASTLVTCRTGFETDLSGEWAAGGDFVSGSSGAGYVEATGTLPDTPLIFERQRLLEICWHDLDGLNPVPMVVVDDLAQKLESLPGLWAIHAWSLDEDAERGNARLLGVAQALERQLTRKDTVLAKRCVPARRLEKRGEGTVLQMVLCGTRVAFSVAPLAALSSPRIGGIFRMPMHEDAPSRSYLKLEEAFARMQQEPQAGQTGVDLGAAPGGWSFALARRGVAVWAVDNGPIKIKPGSISGEVTHLREDGLLWMPAPQHLPVDWLVADMLIAPGDALGLLRRWILARAMRRVVMNFKIPQQHCWPPLQPLLLFLREQKDWTFLVRQLYHDRREITVMGSLRTI